MKLGRGLLRGTLCAALWLVGVVAFGQGQSVGPQAGGVPRFEGGINAATDVNITQKLDAQVPLDAAFRDETGARITLRQYAGKRPLWLVMPFYKCTGTCSQMLNGMVSTLHEKNLKYKIGRDFDIVVISIHPKETADLAASKKKEYLNELGIPGAESGWHFLTGDEKDIQAVANSIGYKYVYDVRRDEYAHASGTFLLTPTGHVSRYFFGVVYPAKDLRLAITEAGQGKIGSVADQFLLFCYHYDPQRGRYGLAVFRLMQVLGTLTVLSLGSYMILSFRNDQKKNKSVDTGANAIPDDSSERLG